MFTCRSMFNFYSFFFKTENKEKFTTPLGFYFERYWFEKWFLKIQESVRAMVDGENQFGEVNITVEISGLSLNEQNKVEKQFDKS